MSKRGTGSQALPRDQGHLQGCEVNGNGKFID
jgi:hypothetical protein